MKQVLTIIALIAGPASAADPTGAHLLHFCKSDMGVASGYCTGYIFGVSQGSEAQSRMFKRVDVLNEWPHFVGICAPDNIVPQDMVDIVVRRIDADPQMQSSNAADVVWFILSDAFPCD